MHQFPSDREHRIPGEQIRSRHLRLDRRGHVEIAKTRGRGSPGCAWLGRVVPAGAAGMKQDKIGGLVSIAIGAASLAETAILYPYRLNSISGDFVMPGVVGVLLVVLGLLLVFRVKTPPHEIERAGRRAGLQMLGTVVILFAYWYAISELGYVIGTLLASLGLFKVVSGSGWGRGTGCRGLLTARPYRVW